MAVAIVLEGLICAGAYCLFKFTSLGAIMIILILFALIMILTAVSYLLCNYKATKNIEKMTI